MADADSKNCLPNGLTLWHLASKMTKRAISQENPFDVRMRQDTNPPSAVDQAVSRALRENLERIQRTTQVLGGM
jgi:hypothetical protein